MLVSGRLGGLVFGTWVTTVYSNHQCLCGGLSGYETRLTYYWVGDAMEGSVGVFQMLLGWSRIIY